MKKVLIIIGKIIMFILIGVVALLLLAIVGLNIAKHFIYSDYYSIKTNICNDSPCKKQYRKTRNAGAPDKEFPRQDSHRKLRITFQHIIRQSRNHCRIKKHPAQSDPNDDAFKPL